jgi:hypothetical protein
VARHRCNRREGHESATSFALHIQPLFTLDQQACMVRSFDLAKYQDVKQWRVKIAHSLAAKTMPADASNPWPDEWICVCAAAHRGLADRVQHRATAQLTRQSDARGEHLSCTPMHSDANRCKW